MTLNITSRKMTLYIIQSKMYLNITSEADDFNIAL
jgi:hypothetical protein